MGRFIRESNSDRFRKMMSRSIASSVILFVVGIVMLFMPELTNRIIGMVIGAMILISGFNTISKYIKRDGARLYSYNLIFGIILMVLGLIIMLVPFSVSSLITACLGLYFIIMGSNKITYGIWLRIGDHSSWGFTITVGLMLIFFGIILIVNPFSALTLTKLVGAFFVISSILDITSTFMLRSSSDEITKIFW